MSLRKEIEKASNLFELAELDSSCYDIKESTRAKNAREAQERRKINCIKAITLDKSIDFPKLDEYVKTYMTFYNSYKHVWKNHPLARLSNFCKEYSELMAYLECERDFIVDSITIKLPKIKAQTYVASEALGAEVEKQIVVTNPTIVSKMLSLTWTHFATKEYYSDIEAMLENGLKIAPRKDTYNKKLIHGLLPLRRHLHKHNPKLKGKKLYSYLSSFTMELGFTISRKGKTDAVGPDTIRRYLSGMK